MRLYLPDTNALSDLINNPFGQVASKAITIASEDLLTSVIVACELRYDAERCGSAALRALVEGALDRFAVENWLRG